VHPLTSLLARKLWTTSGKTPSRTVEARICTDIKNKGSSSAFVRVAPRVFGLRELGAQPMSRRRRAGPPKRKTTRGKKKTYSFTDAAEKVLEELGNKQPMHYRAITQKAIGMGWLATKGKTPEVSMSAAIGTEIRRYKKRGDQPRFAQHGRGYVGLTRWMGRGLAFQIEQHNRRVRRALHQGLLKIDPGAFEQLIGRLLAELGFEDIEVTNRSGDGGIDVRGTLVVGDVIRTRMAVQVKRWRKSSNVQAPVVQQVRGSLGAHEQGLIITTSDFSKGAHDEASRSDAVPVALMNGEQLVALLVEHDIGVARLTHDIIELAETEKELDEPKAVPESLPRPSRTQKPAKAQGERRAKERRKTPRVPGLPTEREMELPLLRAIIKRGGRVATKAERLEIARELADLYGLSQQQRSAKVAGRGESVWYNHMCWTRQHLVLRDQIAKGPRGVWAVTQKGRERVEAVT